MDSPVISSSDNKTCSPGKRREGLPQGHQRLEKTLGACLPAGGEDLLISLTMLMGKNYPRYVNRLRAHFQASMRALAPYLLDPKLEQPAAAFLKTLLSTPAGTAIAAKIIKLLFTKNKAGTARILAQLNAADILRLAYGSSLDVGAFCFAISLSAKPGEVGNFAKKTDVALWLNDLLSKNFEFKNLSAQETALLKTHVLYYLSEYLDGRMSLGEAIESIKDLPGRTGFYRVDNDLGSVHFIFDGNKGRPVLSSVPTGGFYNLLDNSPLLPPPDLKEPPEKAIPLDNTGNGLNILEIMINEWPKKNEMHGPKETVLNPIDRSWKKIRRQILNRY